MASNAEIIWKYFRKYFNPYATAGLMGNLYAESGLKPTNLQDSFEKKTGYNDESYTEAVDTGAYTKFSSDGAGYGLAQWTSSSRKANLIAAAKEKQVSIGNLEMQLDFIMDEIVNKYNKKVYTPLLKAMDVREASDIVMTQYERPANQSEANKQRRAAQCQKYYDAYAGDDNGSSSTTILIPKETSGEIVSSTEPTIEHIMVGDKLSIKTFIQELEAALWRKDGYIMGAYGQNPRTGSLDLKETEVKSSWKITGYYYKQYNGNGYTPEQYKKALYWRETATRVWDCNGMADGIYQIHTGKNINSRAQGNYNRWCSIKGKGMIPADKRRSGAAVFWGNNDQEIKHVAYLWKPVEEGNTAGDWWLIEARGVIYGVVSTKLLKRKPQFWGYMTKYYSYDDVPTVAASDDNAGKVQALRSGDIGNDVTILQLNLKQLGYLEEGKYTESVFDSRTLAAVKAFQTDNGLIIDGIVSTYTMATIEKALTSVDPTDDEDVQYCPASTVTIKNGNCWIRTGPSKTSSKVGIARKGSVYEYGGSSQNGWTTIIYDGKNRYISAEYGEISESQL